MKILIVLTLVFSSLSVHAGWYQSSDGTHYYTAGNTGLLTLEYRRNNPKQDARSEQAWQKGLERYLASKTKEEVLKNAPDELAGSKKVVFIPGKGFTIQIPTAKVAGTRGLAGSGRGMTGGGELVIGTSGGIPQSQDSGELVVGGTISAPSGGSEITGPGTTSVAATETSSNSSARDCGEGLTLGPGDPCSRPENNNLAVNNEEASALSSETDLTGTPETFNADSTAEENQVVVSNQNGGMCQETLSAIAVDMQVAMQIVQEQYIKALEEEGCEADEVEEIEIGQL